MFFLYLLPPTNLTKHEFPSKKRKIFIRINGNMRKPVKNHGKWIFSPYLLPPTTKATIPALGNNGNLCKTWNFHPKTWKIFFLESMGACPNLQKPWKMNVFHIFVTTKAPQVTNLGQMDVSPIFATSYHQGHQGTILDLCNNGNPCKTSNFYPKIRKHSFLESVEACPKL